MRNDTRETANKKQYINNATFTFYVENVSGVPNAKFIVMLFCFFWLVGGYLLYTCCFVKLLGKSLSNINPGKVISYN